jgi:hypothetical protein
MKSPWGATLFQGQWSMNATSLTLSNIQGNTGDIELVFVSGPYSTNVSVTASDAGGSFATSSVSMRFIWKPWTSWRNFYYLEIKNFNIQRNTFGYCDS